MFELAMVGSSGLSHFDYLGGVLNFLYIRVSNLTLSGLGFYCIPFECYESIGAKASVAPVKRFDLVTQVLDRLICFRAAELENLRWMSAKLVKPPGERFNQFFGKKNLNNSADGWFNKINYSLCIINAHRLGSLRLQGKM